MTVLEQKAAKTALAAKVVKQFELFFASCG
jgi:hypothetical protein